MIILLLILITLALIVVGFYVGGPEVGICVGFVILLFSGSLGLSFVNAHYNERTLTCTVTDKDRGGKEGDYRIYTEDCGQLANVDSWWRGKVDSADVWQQIEPGHTYRLHVVGWRSPLFSDFPNVLDVTEVNG